MRGRKGEGIGRGTVVCTLCTACFAGRGEMGESVKKSNIKETGCEKCALLRRMYVNASVGISIFSFSRTDKPLLNILSSRCCLTASLPAPVAFRRDGRGEPPPWTECRAPTRSLSLYAPRQLQRQFRARPRRCVPPTATSAA